MKRPSLFLLLTLASLPVLAHTQEGVTKIGEFSVNFKPGKFRVESFSATKGKMILTGVGTSVVKIVSPQREVRAQKIVALVEQAGSAKETRLTEATATGTVYAHLVQKDAKGNVYSYTVTCDTAVFKAGPKSKTGRLDFSGNARLVYDTPLTEGETTGTKGYIDLGDPDDPAKSPVFELEDGTTTGRPKSKGKTP